VNSRRK
jgi:hypothetical protein